MEEDLLNILNNSDEAVYELDAYLAKQSGIDNKQKWEALKEIALRGTQKQRFFALTVISVNKPDYLEAISLELIENHNFSEIEPILKPICNICSTIGKEIHANYMEEVLDYAIKNNKEYLAEVVLRNIISTKYWRRVIGNILQIVSISDNLTIVDLLSFFIYQQGNDEYSLLINHFSKENQEKIAKLQIQILERLKNGYQKLNV
ncbi:MAG: hypothetical protein FD181_3719 [Prolixibacteraceae bacterium]|nr:MAG: hypothetical protein FD181_3719 [Prolixibacteraceae bacterium]